MAAPLGADDEIRTRTPPIEQRILSPLCLPIPPHRRKYALSRIRTCNLAIVVLRVATAALPLSYEGKRGRVFLESSLTPTHKDALILPLSRCSISPLKHFRSLQRLVTEKNFLRISLLEEFQ